MDMDKISQAFTHYVRTFDLKDPGVQLKYAHSIRVSENCRVIGESLGLSQSDVDLTWAMGLLHDIGRFEQLRQYHTFSDGRSMNHAAYGARYLFQEGHIRDFLAETTYDDLLEEAIRQHSAYELGGPLTERQRLFCQLLRDGDKVDIFRVYAQYAHKLPIIWNATWEELLTAPVTPEVMAAARQRHSIRTALKKTPMDYFMGGLCMVFDLVYPKSRQLVQEQGYYAKLLAVHSKNPESEKCLAEVREMIDKNYE